MPNKMERFTQRSRRALSLAQEEAERMEHSHIGVEHLLLGLMREEGGVASRVLHQLGLKLDEARVIVVELNSNEEKISGKFLDLSPGTKRALELAVDEARKMGHHYIGTEHLLLGLNRQRDKRYVEILNKFGITPDEVLRQTRRVLQEPPSPSEPPAVYEYSAKVELDDSSLPTRMLRRYVQIRLLSKLISKLAETLDDAGKTALRTQIETLYQEALLEVSVPLSNIEQSRLLNQIIAPLKKSNVPEVFIRLSDRNDSKLKFEIKTTLVKLQERLLTLMEVVFGDAASKIELVDENVRIEITFTESSE